MFGTYRVPFSLRCGDTTLEVTKNSGVVHYSRKSGDEQTDLHILGDPEILVQPTEPLQTPKPVATALMLALEKEIVVPPKAEETVYLTFPVEVGIFAQTKGAVELIDVFSLQPSRFTLYGTLKDGHICKHWPTAVSLKLPETEGMKTGTVRLLIKNASDKWANIDQVVINAYDLKIYFHEDFCSVSARMKILGQRIAQVECESSSLKPGMTRAIEVFEKGKMTVMSKKFLMEEGL